MSMRVIRSEYVRAMPWRNGAGTTWEIVIAPPTSGLDSFDWRISMATVLEPGPFSIFPGVDRSLAVLEGQGVTLSLPAGEPVTLGAASQPVEFPGEWSISCTPLDGPLVDFNVMTRRNRFSHWLKRMIFSGHHEMPDITTPFGVFVASGQGLTVTDETGANVYLRRNDLLMVEDVRAPRLTATCDGPVSALVFALIPHATPMHSQQGDQQ